MSAEPLLIAQDVSFGYAAARPVLRDVSLSIAPGEWIAIVGPNGCGKSTLLRLLIGQRVPSAGSVTLRGTPLDAIPPRAIARAMALVPQNTAVPFGYSVREMVLMARYHLHSGMLPTFETSDDFAAADEAMAAMDVLALADRPITTLSGGERQRVMIARALCQHTPILLLDEPTSALDLHHQLELMERLAVLVRQRQTAVVLVTHDLNAARRTATRTVVMSGGTIAADGPPEQVLTPAVLESIYRVRVELRGEVMLFSRQ